jgi:hypothetical protein
MKRRRAHRPVVRRLVAAAVAAVIGVAGSFAVATPSQATMPCDVTAYTVSWGDPSAPQYYVIANIRNTGSATSIGWVVYITLPTGTTTQLYWGVRAMPMYGDGWYTAADYDAAIPAGQSAGFGLMVSTPSGVVPTPSFACAISY